MVMSRSWLEQPEPAQADYETLRAAALAGTPILGVAASRFARLGLAALITRPVSEPSFVAVLTGARRPPWTPHRDPRVDVLAAAVRLLLADDDERIDGEVAW